LRLLPVTDTRTRDRLVSEVNNPQNLYGCCRRGTAYYNIYKYVFSSNPVISAYDKYRMKDGLHAWFMKQISLLISAFSITRCHARICWIGYQYNFIEQLP
jgi:hypothetical protein